MDNFSHLILDLAVGIGGDFRPVDDPGIFDRLGRPLKGPKYIKLFAREAAEALVGKEKLLQEPKYISGATGELTCSKAF